MGVNRRVRERRLGLGWGVGGERGYRREYMIGGRSFCLSLSLSVSVSVSVCLSVSHTRHLTLAMILKSPVEITSHAPGQMSI